MLTRVQPKNKPSLARVRTIKPVLQPAAGIVEPPQPAPEESALTPQPHPVRRFWQTPFGWLKQVDFYRDAFAGALGTGIAALFAYLYAVGAGYIASPTKRQAIVGVGLAVLPAVIGAVASYSLHTLARYVPPKFRRFVGALPYALFWVLALAFFLVAADALWPIPFWPFTTTP